MRQVTTGISTLVPRSVHGETATIVGVRLVWMVTYVPGHCHLVHGVRTFIWKRMGVVIVTIRIKSNKTSKNEEKNTSESGKTRWSSGVQLGWWSIAVRENQ